MNEVKSAQPQLPPLPKPLRTSEFWDDGIEWAIAGERAARLERERQLLSALAGNESLKASLDEARSGCVAWECAVSSLKAHLQDRIVMKDESQPDIYLSILQSDVANVTRDTEQIREATWHRERLYAARAEKAEAERDQALEVIREYREDKGSEHHYCRKEVRYPITGMHDDRCPTCIKADELLSRETKET